MTPFPLQPLLLLNRFLQLRCLQFLDVEEMNFTYV